MDPRYVRILIGIGSAIVVLLIVLIVVIAIDDGDPQAASTSTTTVAPPSSTTTPPATALPDTTTSTAVQATSSSTTDTTAAPATTSTTAAPMPTGPCAVGPSNPVGAGATDLTVALGDVDGNGHADEVTVYREAGSWWLNVTLDYGWATEVPIAGMVARAHSIVDMGVAEEVIVAQIDAGASAEIIGFFAFQGCEIVHVTDAGTGLETAFPVGGTVTHLDGVTCTADGITVTRARQDSDDASQWSVSATNYLYVPGSAEFQAVTSAAALLTSPADDAAIFATAEFNC